jgi:hypothetical protein
MGLVGVGLLGSGLDEFEGVVDVDGGLDEYEKQGQWLWNDGYGSEVGDANLVYQLFSERNLVVKAFEEEG